MHTRNILLSTALTTLGCLSLSTAADAFSLGGHMTSDGYRSDGTAWEADHDYNALFPDGNSTDDTAFVAESRYGDAGGAAQYEFKIFDHQDGGGLDEANFNWGNGTSYDFSLEYTESSWTYSLFEFGTENLLTSVTEAFTAPFSDIFIRTRANNGTSAVVDNLFLDGVAVGDRSAVENVEGDFGVDYLRISDVSEPFTLTGTSTMSWTEGSNTKGSRLAYQIKVVNLEDTQPVPEPTILVGLGISLLGLTRLRRTRF
ncbi:MAG: PEP-CTERM sorting domain-containing protein [Microcoleaceae cyanobacterium]